jgi:hypothetical protein
MQELQELLPRLSAHEREELLSHGRTDVDPVTAVSAACWYVRADGGTSVMISGLIG